MKHYMYVPFTGLGLYNGYRGSRWLRNRISVFKQFVVPSLLAQTNQNFSVWVSWRREEKNNKQVKDLHLFLTSLFGRERVIFTYHGVCFWDDKYEDKEAHERLITSLHHTLGELINDIGDVDDVLMTIQPSDDCYQTTHVADMQHLFKSKKIDAAGYTMGYIMSYQTLETREYNPETNPPFFTIRFDKATFIDPLKHLMHTGPYKSHEYVPTHMKYGSIEERGFLVGTHGENISTHFNHPYAGEKPVEVKERYGLESVQPLNIRYSLRKQIMRKLPYGWQRKLRYIFGEKLYAKFYKFIRS
jgi:hypothetical protein